MKKFVNRSLSAILERYLAKVDENQVSSLISNGQYEEKNLSFKPSLLYDLKLPFTIDSSKIDSFKIDTTLQSSIFLAQGIKLISTYSDCKEFNPYVINPPSLTFFASKIFPEKMVKKIIFSYLFKSENINVILKNSLLHFEIPRCNKSDKNNTKKSNHSTLGSFGFIFDEISLSENKVIKITNMSIYVFPQLEHIKIDNIETFKNSLENNYSSFILQNFNYEGQVDNLQITNEIELSFDFTQISFLKFFGRKLRYSDCGCPNVYSKDSCLDWWTYVYRCFLKDKYCFNVKSALQFLKNRQSFNSNFERNQFLMFNRYKKSTFRLTNSYQKDVNSVEFTKNEKDAFIDFYNQSEESTALNFNYKLSFLNKLKIKVRNTNNGYLDLGQIQIQKDNGSITLQTDQIVLSYDFLTFLFLLIKDRLKSRDQNIKEFKVNIPSIKIIGNNSKNDIIGTIEINNLLITDSSFSIDSIQNDNKTFSITNISAQDTNHNPDADKDRLKTIKKNYMIKVEDTKLTTNILYNLLFYRKNNINYNNSSPKLNIHYILYFFNQIEYVLSLSNVSLFIGNDNQNFISFKMHFVNTFDSLVIGIDKITFGNIIKDFVITATINNDNEGKLVFFDLNVLKISIFPSEFPILINLLTEIKPLIYLSFKMIPELKSFVLCSKGFTLILETTEYSLAQLDISDFQIKSICGFAQFSINNNQALFYDRKLNKWCVLIQPFNIVSNIQVTNIEISLSLQFNFTRIFFNEIIKFFTSNEKRVEFPRKVKIKNYTAYPLIIEERREPKQTAKNKDDDDEQEEEENTNDNNRKVRLDINKAVFVNSKKFRIEVENNNKDFNESYTIDSNHLQFPLYISNKIVLSKGENSICFCSPFVFENKSTFKNLSIYEIKKDDNSNNNDYKISLLGVLNSKSSKLGVYHPDVLITGETDNATQIFVSHLNDSKEEDREFKMISAISSTFDKKPQLIDITYNGNKETILVASEFNYEKGALFIRLMNPFVIVNQVPECKSVSLSLSASTTIPNEKKKQLKKNEVESDSPALKIEINELLLYEKASVPIQMIPSCSLFFQTQQIKNKNKNNKNLNNSFDIVVKLNDFLGMAGKSIQSSPAHIIVSEDYQFFPIQFSESQFSFSLALKIQFNPRKGNWSFILFAPSVIENRTNLDISINSLGKESISNFFLAELKKNNQNSEEPTKLIFGCESFFSEARSMPVFIGYNREFKLSDRPIELCFAPFSSPLMLPSVIHNDCYLPLIYRTSSRRDDLRNNRNNGLSTFIDYYKIIENNTSFDFTLTPINQITDSNTFATLAKDESNDDKNKNKNRKNSRNKEEEEEYSDDNNRPQLLFKQNEKKPILLATHSFCYKFEYEDTVLPICLLNNNYRTCFRVEKSLFVLLTITEKYARFEMSDFSPQKVFMTFTNLLPKETIFVNSSTSQPPIYIGPNSTSLFGYDSPFESKEVSIFALGEQVNFKVDRCYEPLSSPMNKFVVQCESKKFESDSEDIVHSIVVRSTDTCDAEDTQNSTAASIPSFTSPNGANLNVNSNLKGATTISIERESNQDLTNIDSDDRNDFEYDTDDDPFVNSRIMNQINDRLNYSYDIYDYDNFPGYSLTVSIPIFEISLIDDRLTELALICLYQSTLKATNERSMTTKMIHFSIKSLQVFDMNVMTLFPTVISSNPENANFLTVEIGYFDRLTVDQFKVTISPILISPDINFLNEIYYFFRKIDNISEIVNKVQSNSLICQSKLFNLIQVDPIVIVINIRIQSTRNLNTPKLVAFNKNLTTSFALNGFVIHNTDMSPSFFLSLLGFFLQMKLNYAKLFYIPSQSDKVLNKRKPSPRRRKSFSPSKVATLLSIDDIEERIINAKVYRHLFNFPSLILDPLVEKNLKDKPAKILDALSQTESYFKLASDKMRLISNDKIDRDEYLIPQRKRRSQTLPATSTETSSSAAAESNVQGSVRKEKAANAAQTVANGFSSAAKSFRSGFTGIIRKPIEGGKEDGARGAFKGIGQGLLGVLTCAVSSAFEVGSGIAGGIRKSIIKDNTSNYEQCRPPSTFLLRCISTNSANISEDGEGNSYVCYKEDVRSFFDPEMIELAEQAQQVINNGQYLALPKEKEDRLVFFSDVEQNAKRISYIGITTDSIFVFNASLSVLNRFDLDSITWFKKKIESFANNDHEFENDKNINRKIVFDVFNPSIKKETRYELELPSENVADLAVQFFSSKLRAFDIIRDVQEQNK